ncbi:LysE family translocator [Paracoccaceae bacterium Fryx2]|nr:LysE family translocator [Paracoccaceae bacterium Fryx2]
MTVSAADLLFYAGALLVLFATPGPVWVALLARAMSGGFNAAWPLAVGVTVGDALWPLLAIFGLTWIVSQFASFMLVMHWVAAATFLVMGAMLIRHAGRGISADSRLTRPGLWAGFATGVAVVIGNPKAILFYMGVLPGFFDLSRVTAPDIAAIVALSVAIPLAGNLILAASIGRARRLLTSPAALRRANLIAGGLMMLVGVGIALS